jgi:hypothetical protein
MNYFDQKSACLPAIDIIYVNAHFQKLMLTYFLDSLFTVPSTRYHLNCVHLCNPQHTITISLERKEADYRNLRLHPQRDDT